MKTQLGFLSVLAAGFLLTACQPQIVPVSVTDPAAYERIDALEGKMNNSDSNIVNRLNNLVRVVEDLGVQQAETLQSLTALKATIPTNLTERLTAVDKKVADNDESLVNIINGLARKLQRTSTSVLGLQNKMEELDTGAAATPTPPAPTPATASEVTAAERLHRQLLSR